MPNATFEFVIPQRPVSLQTRKRQNLQAWKAFVTAEAAKAWPVDTQPLAGELRVTLVYLAADDAADVDNIIKPIQDALVGMVYDDDFAVCDVDCHRRFLSDPIDVTDLPPLLQAGVAKADECVYVRVSHASDLKDYL
ncbi:endodeoxyribonuclease RusA [Burkholderia vietnamiensis]|uniref:RusA family crossover junction endodeoxyribonuclease n=1 Tax=Burkholderia vietnamiensis TaxID=60552 RepID=UPI000753CE55|nr:RusA family crossover junction endodeoxyribonuclease [Burkholderia vietnamiensis]KVE25170.1 endodeoxyribonuclease RusA [Burkholderia vietnamiensis]